MCHVETAFPPRHLAPASLALFTHMSHLRRTFHANRTAIALAFLGVAATTMAAVSYSASILSLVERLVALFDLRLLVALFTGAAASCGVNFAFQWATRGANPLGQESSSYGAPGGGVMGAALPDEWVEGAQEIPDNACYFCVRRAATSKCGRCR